MDSGKFDVEVAPLNKIGISSYVTKQKNPTYVDDKAITNSAKYRYELVMQSNSVYGGRLTKTWIYGARVFIDSLEVTREQSPEGFSAIIGITPTIIYRYDTSLDTINIKVSWKSSQYYRDR